MSFDFDNAFLEKLERLALLNRRLAPGPSSGSRRSPRYGSSVEFADFRDYTVGDDLRRVDWSAYARLDRLFLRLYRAEEVTTVSLLLDHSASMQIGNPPKARVAAQLAAVLSFIALHRDDRVAVFGWGTKIDYHLPAQGGSAAVPRVWQAIAQVMDGGAKGKVTDFSALRDFGAYRRGPGLAIVISDFLADGDWRAPLRALRAGQQEVTVIQLLAPEDLEPGLRGDWTLRDAESSALVDVSASSRVMQRYSEALSAHIASIRDDCRRQGMTFLQLSSDVSIADTALTSLRSAGVIQ